MGPEKNAVPEALPESKETGILPIKPGLQRNSSSTHSEKKSGDAVIDVPKTDDDEDKGGFSAYLVNLHLVVFLFPVGLD